jgi:hypothetical protein
MFQMLGVFAEFEASMIRERVRTGMSRAKRSGTKSGRSIGRPRLGQDKEAAAQKLLGDGMGILKVARTLKIGSRYRPNMNSTVSEKVKGFLKRKSVSHSVWPLLNSVVTPASSSSTSGIGVVSADRSVP